MLPSIYHIICLIYAYLSTHCSLSIKYCRWWTKNDTKSPNVTTKRDFAIKCIYCCSWMTENKTDETILDYLLIRCLFAIFAAQRPVPHRTHVLVDFHSHLLRRICVCIPRIYNIHIIFCADLFIHFWHLFFIFVSFLSDHNAHKKQIKFWLFWTIVIHLANMTCMY